MYEISVHWLDGGGCSGSVPIYASVHENGTRRRKVKKSQSKQKEIQ
jgi:hypothetical protein